MKFLQLISLAGIVMLPLYAAVAATNTASASHYQWNFGVNERYVSFQDTNTNFAPNSGFMHGVTGGFTYQAPVQFSINMNYAQGTTDYYTSAARSYSTKPKNSLFDVVASVARPVYYLQRHFVPYVGIGYRYFNNDALGVMMNQAQQGYNSKQATMYVPVGFSTQIARQRHWQMLLNVRYDFIFEGTQKTYSSQINSGSAVTARDHGFGVHVSADWQTNSAYGLVTVSPYYSHYSFKGDEQTIANTSIQVKNNTTTETGMAVTLNIS
jgi:opacity protein-like surface antigen